MPQPVGDFRHAMAERYEMIIDFAKYPIGQRVVLQNLQPKNNIEFDNTDKVMAFDVVADAPRRSTATRFRLSSIPAGRPWH